jgi:hypothetical protein
MGDLGERQSRSIRCARSRTANRGRSAPDVTFSLGPTLPDDERGGSKRKRRHNLAMNRHDAAIARPLDRTPECDSMVFEQRYA